MVNAIRYLVRTGLRLGDDAGRLSSVADGVRWLCRFVRRLLFNIVHDIALTMDRKCLGCDLNRPNREATIARIYNEKCGLVSTRQPHTELDCPGSGGVTYCLPVQILRMKDRAKASSAELSGQCVWLEYDRKQQAPITRPPFGRTGASTTNVAALST